MAHEDIERWSPLKALVYSLFNGSPKSNLIAIERLELTGQDRFLDIGCGPGAALEHAASTGARVAGVDPSPAMVARASNRVPSAEVRLGSAESIPFEDGEFNVVINISSFHHWADRNAGLVEVLRVLEPGGRLHVVEGALRDGKDGHGLDQKEAEMLAARLEEVGYTDTSVDQFKPRWRHEYFVVSGSLPAQ